jgi:hypothetical protein
MSDEFEKALRRALRPRDAGEDFCARVVSRLDATVVPSEPSRIASIRGRAFRSPWLPVALAASLIAGIGLIQVRQDAVHAARANQARAQLLQALSIASRNINIVRAAVAREENPDS